MLVHWLDQDSELAESKDLGLLQQHLSEVMHRQRDDGNIKKK